MLSALILPATTHQRLITYADYLRTGRARAGARLARQLSPDALTTLTPERLLAALLDTKAPCIFAESAVRGDGSDWSPNELVLLGDICVATDVTVFDDGRHRSPAIHPVPFAATQVFTPGALLRNDLGLTPADWAEVTDCYGQLDPSAYSNLYVRRLYPVFSYIQHHATRSGVRALVTVPGLGCGQFAGPFRGRLGAQLESVLESLLSRHAPEWPALRAVYFDPYDECAPRRAHHHGIDYLVRPLALSPHYAHPQLCPPAAYSERSEDDFAECRLYSLVAWDHVSWPGNDFNAGSRATDDGVKAAATSALHSLTGIEGRYDPARHAYRPPPPAVTWSELIAGRPFPTMPVFTTPMP